MHLVGLGKVQRILHRRLVQAVIQPGQDGFQHTFVRVLDKLGVFPRLETVDLGVLCIALFVHDNGLAAQQLVFVGIAQGMGPYWRHIGGNPLGGVAHHVDHFFGVPLGFLDIHARILDGGFGGQPAPDGDAPGGFSPVQVCKQAGTLFL